MYLLGRVVCPETYLGTRMNEKALLFHTRLHDWSEAQNLAHTAITSKTLNIAKEREVFLPVKKLSQIEYWTRDVNKYYHPKRPGTAKSGSFMYIDVSKYNMKDTERSNILRPKSAIVGSVSRPGQRPISAVTTHSVPRRRFFGNDIHTIHNNLVESQFHYSALRKNVYSAKSSKPTTNTNTVEIIDSVKNDDSSPKSYSSSTYESEITSTLANSTETKQTDIEQLGQGHVNPQVMQPVITSRSWSNKMLNVISIDDCKLACRYRPQKIKEQREAPMDYEKIDEQKTKASKRKKKPQNTEKVTDNVEIKSDSHVDADDENDEDDNDSDVDLDVNDIHLSPDRNNNEIAHQIIITEATPRNEDYDSDTPYLPNVKPTTVNENDASEQADKVNDEDNTDNAFADSKDIVNDHVDKHILKQKDVDAANREVEDIMNSRGTPSKTSYGRITTLYSNSVMTNHSKPQKKKKVSRTQRLNNAIDDMIGERKVMSATTKDFDRRVSEFGRTVIDKQEGSETFKKMHSNLRKKMDDFIDYKSAMKTKKFLEKRRLNSNTSSSASGVDNV